MNLRQLRLLGHAVRYTRPHQLAHRLKLMLKRKALARLASRRMIERTAHADARVLRWRADAPKPLLPPRRRLVSSVSATGEITLNFLNRRRALGEPIDWRPEDLKVGTRLWLLNLHYHEFLEGLDESAAAAVMLDWIERVRPFDPGYWLDNWNSYSLSIRVVVWMQQLAARDLPFDDTQRSRVQGSLIAQLRFLRKNLELDIGGNHLIKNIKALLWSRAALEGPEAEAWGEMGDRLLDRELAEQILPDGMHYELSPTYHNQVFADLIDCYTALPDGERRVRLRDLLDRMAQVCVDFRHPDGGVSQFNDGGLYFAYTPDECLDAWGAVRSARPTAQQLFALPSAGYYGLRCCGAHGEQLVVVDCAELAPTFLPAHGHGDALALEWSVGGKRIFVDAGVYEYNPGERRAYSRATSSHNTVSLDGEDQSEFWKAFRVGRRAHITRCEHRPDPERTGFNLIGAHDGYSRMAGRPLHEREVSAAQDELQIVDRIVGGSGQRAEARLLLHPDCLVELQPGGCLIRNGNISIELKTTAAASIEEASWHPDQGIDVPTKRLKFSLGVAPCEGRIDIKVLRAGSP